MAAPDYRTIARQIAQQYGIDPDVFVAQINQESGFNPNAKSPAGAEGIAQFMPGTAQGLGIDPMDPIQALKGAAKYDAALLAKYHGDYRLMLAAYNAGEGNVDKYGGVPPFQETQTYVKNILGSSGGGQTMGTLQDGTPSTDDLVNQGLNGDSSTISNPSGQQAFQALSSSNAGGSGLSQTEWASLVQQHKGIVGQKQVKTAATDAVSSVLGAANPATEYTFGDGTHITVQFAGGAAGTDGSWNVIDGGTALKTGKQPTTMVPILDPRTGQPIALRDPSTGTVLKLDPQNTMATPQGQIVQSNGGVYLITKGQPTAAYPGQMPQSGGVTVETLIAPDQTKANLDNQLTQLQIQKAQQSLRPVAQQAISDAYTTIDSIQQQLAAGTMTPQEANSLMQQVHDGLNATLSGTTLFEQQKQADAVQAQRVNEANALLNQRVSSGVSLGNALLNAAVGHVMMPAGKTTLGIDPFAIANQEIATLGGGPQVTDAAKALLANAFGGGQASPGQSPAPGPALPNGLKLMPWNGPQAAPTGAPPNVVPWGGPAGTPTPGTSPYQPQGPVGANAAIQAGAA